MENLEVKTEKTQKKVANKPQKQTKTVVAKKTPSAKKTATKASEVKAPVKATTKKTPEKKVENAEKKQVKVSSKEVQPQPSKELKFNGKTVKITFLGGVGEIGKNMTAIEYGDEMIIIDSGLAFPTGDFPGVDLIVPDISYLVANKSKIKGILLTHGHEDHIGALPFVLNEIKVPVYGSAMTLALV